MGIFDSIAGALNNIFGGGTQQSNTAQTASSNNNRSNYGSNDYLAASTTTNKQIQSKKSPGTTTTKETTTTQHPQQTQPTAETTEQQQSQQSVVLPSINPTINKLKQNSEREDTATNDKQQDSDTTQDKTSESESTKYQDILSQLPNPLETIGSWINPEVADAQSTGETGQEIQKEQAAKEQAAKEDAEQQQNFFKPGDTILNVKQIEQAAKEDAEQQQGFEPSNMVLDAKQMEQALKQIEQAAKEQAKQHRQKIDGQQQYDDSGHLIYKQNNKYGNRLATTYSAATTGDDRVGLDEAVARDAYAQTGDERYNPDSDIYYLKHQNEKGYEDVNPYNIDGYEDFQEFYTGRHEDGNSWTKGETRRWIMQHPDVATYIVNTPELRTAIESGTLDKATFRGIVDDYVNDMYDKAYTAADVQAAKKQAESSGDMSDFYNTYFSANTVDGSGLNEVLNNSFADYIASQMENSDKYNTGSQAYDKWLNNLITQGKYSDGNLAADNGLTQDAYTYKDIIDNYNQAQANGGANEQITAMYNDAINKLAANMSLIDDLVMANTTNKNNMDLDTINNTVVKHYNTAGLYGNIDELTDLGNQYQEDANDAQTEQSKNATAAVKAAEDKGAALYDAYRDTSDGDFAYSRAYDSDSMDLSTKQGINALYRALSNNGISQYNNDSGIVDQEAIQKRVDELNSSTPGSWAVGGYRTARPNYDINPVLTSLMASGYAAPTGGVPSSLAYVFTPNNLKTAVVTADTEEQQN